MGVIYRFEEYELEPALFELRRNGQRCALEPQVFDLLKLLVEHRDRVVMKDEIIEHIWPERYISEAALTSRLMAARKAIGDSGNAQRLIRTVHGRGYRFVGEVQEQHDRGKAATVPATAPAPSQSPAAAGPSPRIHYTTTSDGYSIAYAVSGSGPPLIRCIGWLTHLEAEWDWAPGRRFWERLSRHHTVIRYDGRGMGLSDPADDLSVPTRVRDLEAVIEATGFERFALFSLSNALYQAAFYTADHPDRVSHLITYGGGPDSETDQKENEAWVHYWDTLRQLMREGWGIDSPLYRQLFTNLLLGPDTPPEEIAEFNEVQRQAATGRTASRFIAVTLAAGVAEAARRITVPTLVMHRWEDMAVPFSRSRRLATMVPGANLITLRGKAHYPYLDADVTEEIATAIERFTGVVSSAPGSPAAS